MTIRNKYDGTIISSPSSIKQELNFFRLTSLGNCNLFFKHDGWEEVEEESNKGWHDLRKNTDDLPPYYHEVIVTNGADSYATFRVRDNPNRDNNDFLRMFNTAGPYNNVIAWCETPKFEEDKK